MRLFKLFFNAAMVMQERRYCGTTTSKLSTNCEFRGAGPISWNPLQAAKQRSCGYMRDLHLYIVPRMGTDASRMMLRMIVGPALRNQERMRWCLSHSCAPSELAVGFWYIRVPSGHGETKLRITRRWLAFLLWEAAWLRRDAIASYVCPYSCKLQFIGETN